MRRLSHGRYPHQVHKNLLPSPNLYKQHNGNFTLSEGVFCGQNSEPLPSPTYHGDLSPPSAPPDFLKTDFDVWVVFRKAQLGRYDRADEALETDYLLVYDGDRLNLNHKKNPVALEAIQEKWKVKSDLLWNLDECVLEKSSSKEDCKEMQV